MLKIDAAPAPAEGPHTCLLYHNIDDAIKLEQAAFLSHGVADLRHERACSDMFTLFVPGFVAELKSFTASVDLSVGPPVGRSVRQLGDFDPTQVPSHRDPCTVTLPPPVQSAVLQSFSPCSILPSPSDIPVVSRSSMLLSLSSFKPPRLLFCTPIPIQSTIPPAPSSL